MNEDENSFKNNELHATLLELVNKSIERLSEGLKLHAETRDLYTKIKTTEEPLRQYDETSLLQEDLLLNHMMDYFIDSRKELLTSQQECSNCVSAMDKDEIISKQINKSHRLLDQIQYVTHWSYISHILKSMVRLYVRYEKVDVQQHDRLYSDLEEFLYNERIKLVEICPLLNFDIRNYPDPIVLSDCLSLRRIDNEQRYTSGNKQFRIKPVIERAKKKLDADVEVVELSDQTNNFTEFEIRYPAVEGEKQVITKISELFLRFALINLHITFRHNVYHFHHRNIRNLNWDS